MVSPDISPDISLTMFKIMYALLAGSAIVIFMTSGLTDNTAINALRGSYFIALCSLIFIFILIRNSLTLSVILAFLPIWTTMVFIIILLYKYYDKISGNKVSDYYLTFMNLTNFLLSIQIYILLSEISIKSFQEFKLTPKMGAILKLFSVLTTVSVITLGIILKQYTTDC
jgi:hypothetical protein